MKLLALDTSSPWTSCALCESDASGAPVRVLAESLHGPPLKAGDLLPGALAALCAQAHVTLHDVQGLAVGLGPGSFTGLRVGLAAAKALAYALRLPLAGCSSLAALALSARSEASGQSIAPTLEARRGELYASLYGSAGEAQLLVWPEGVYQAEAFAERVRSLPSLPLVVGPGAQANHARLGGLAVQGPVAPLAWAVAQLCAEPLAQARFDPALCFALAPNYLQPSMAEVALREGKVGGLPAAKSGGAARGPV